VLKITLVSRMLLIVRSSFRRGAGTTSIYLGNILDIVLVSIAFPPRSSMLATSVGDSSGIPHRTKGVSLARGKYTGNDADGSRRHPY
jgi:hypothetical protein